MPHCTDHRRKTEKPVTDVEEQLQKNGYYDILGSPEIETKVKQYTGENPFYTNIPHFTNYKNIFTRIGEELRICDIRLLVKNSKMPLNDRITIWSTYQYLTENRGFDLTGVEDFVRYGVKFYTMIHKSREWNGRPLTETTLDFLQRDIIIPGLIYRLTISYVDILPGNVRARSFFLMDFSMDLKIHRIMDFQIHGAPMDP